MSTERPLQRKYVKPSCMMVELEMIVFLCTSLSTPGDYGNGGDPFGNSSILNDNEEFNIVSDINKFDALSLFE